MLYPIIAAALAAVAAVFAVPAIALLWSSAVERRDRAFASELLSGEAGKPEKDTVAKSFKARVSMRTRSARFDEQLASVLPMIAKNMKAGHMFEQAAQTAAEFMEEPLRGQFAAMAAERRVGVPLEQVMNNLAARTGSRDARMLAAAVAVQAEMGGAIAETIEAIAAAMRRRAKTRRHVRALTASYRMSAIVIFFVPLAVFAILALMSPENAVLLFTHPVGRVSLVVAALLDVGGMLAIRKLYRMKIY